MPPSDWLPPSRVAELKRALGVDLRVVEAGVRRRAERLANFTAVGTSAAPAAAAAATSTASGMSNKMDAQPPTNLPPVGRHTQTLENKNQFGSGVEARVRKPSLSEVPELKKPKLEAKDVVMHETNAVEPGAPIDSQSTQEEADIPNSPHFATRALPVPHFDLTTEDDKGGSDPTQKDEDGADDDDEPILMHDGQGDELAKAAVASREGMHPHALISNNSAGSIQNSGGAPGGAPIPQAAAGISKWAFGDATSNLPKPPQPTNPGYTALPAAPAPHSSYVGDQNPPETMPPWVREIRDGFWGLHQKADQIHQQMTTYGAEIQAHSVRIANLEQVSSEHTGRHESHDTRIKALESKIEDLLAQLDKSEYRSRSPSRTGLGTGNRSPSPRSPRNGFRSPRALGRNEGFGGEC